jgi:hypothetical protein
MARKNSNLLSVAGVINAQEQEPTITQGQTVLTALNTIDTARVDVFKNGIKLVQDEDYTADSATGITLTTALDDSDHISIHSIGNVSYVSDVFIQGTTASAPKPYVFGDANTGLFSDSADTLSIAAGGTQILKTKSEGIELKSGVGIPKHVSLSQGAVGAGVTYNIDQGNTASLTTDSDKTITFTTTGGNFADLHGVSFTAIIKNNTSPNSDRVMTFVTSTGNTLNFSSENTLTVVGGKVGIVSGMVFGDNDIVLSSVGLDSSVTY